MKWFKKLALTFGAVCLLAGCSSKDVKEDVIKDTKAFIADVKEKTTVTSVEYFTGENIFYNASDNDPQVSVGTGTIVHIAADVNMKEGKNTNMYFSISDDGKVSEIVKFAKDDKGNTIMSKAYAVYSKDEEVKDWTKLTKEEIKDINK